MTKNLIIDIEIGNAATLEPSDQAQLLRIVTDRIESGETEGSVIDYNGNKVGLFKIVSAVKGFSGLESTLSADAIEDLFQDDWEPEQKHINDLLGLVKESFSADPVDVLGYQDMYFEVPEEYIEEYKAKGDDYLDDYFLTVIEDSDYWDFITTASLLVGKEIVDRLGLDWDALQIEAQGQVADTIEELVKGQRKEYLIDQLIAQSES